MSETTDVAVRDENLPRLTGARLPFHPAIEERFGIDRGSWKVLVETIFPAAEAPESVIMALSYCKARRLDIFKKPVHIVPVWDKKRGKMVDTVWPAISELRTTAMRTGEYAGKDATEFGPEVTATLSGVEVTYPAWAQVTVYRFVQGQRCAFVGEQVRWLEYYATAKRDTKAPNEMWLKKAHSQLSKCAEASALRTAFPEEVGNDWTSDEMEGQEVATTPTAEAVTGPGLMARLTNGNNGDGISDGHIERETGRRPRARKAKEPEVPHDPETGEVIEAEAAAEAEAERPTTPEAPTETDGVPSAEPEPDTSASAPAASDSPSLTPASSPPPAPSSTATGEPIAPGHAPAGETYLMAGDGFNAEGRRLTYRDGTRYSTVTGAGAAKLTVYAEHAPEPAPQPADDGIPAHMQDGPATAEQAQAEAVSGEPEMPADYLAYIAAIEAAADWNAVKLALQTLQKTEFWKGLSEAQANKVRAQTWDEVDAKPWRPDPNSDISAFRLCIEAEDDPERIEAALSRLEDHPDFKTKPDTLKEMVRGATSARLSVLASEVA